MTVDTFQILHVSYLQTSSFVLLSAKDYTRFHLSSGLIFNHSILKYRSPAKFRNLQNNVKFIKQ